MKKRIALCVLAAGMTLAAQAQTKSGGITPAMMKSIASQDMKSPAQKALTNAIQNNSINTLAKGKASRMPVPKTFAVETRQQSIQDQKSSGRCWMFSGLNVLRNDFALQNEGKSVVFSQSYLFFWDQLEKSNLFLQSIIDTGRKDINDPEVQFLFGQPLSDGGTFCGVIDLVGKYGLVPQSVAPETFSSESTSQASSIIKRKLREYGLRLRQIVAEGKKPAALAAEKTAMLKTVYGILSTVYGEPVETFTYQHTDKDGKPVGEQKEYTPLSFAKECGATGLDTRYLIVMNDPRHAYHKVYEVEYDRHTYDGHNWRFLNLPMDEIEALAVTALKAGKKLYTSYDIKDFDSKRGLASLDVYDYESLFQTSFPMDKAERLATRESASAHAMTLTAVDTTATGKPRYWKVENSWGAASGQNGCVVMTDEWFREYTFRLCVEKQYVPEALIKEAGQKPVMLKYDDILFSEE